MKALIVQNDRSCAPGYVETSALANGFDVRVVRSDKNDVSDVRPNDYDGICVLGGFADAYDFETNPYLNDVTRMLRDAVDTEVPVFAICLGAQLASIAFGGSAFPSGKGREVGWQKVLRTEAGKSDELVGALNDDDVFIQWHQDTYTLPEGAVQLLSSDQFEQQGFRYGSITAVQFHPEVDESIVKLLHRVTVDREPQTPALAELLEQFETKAAPGRGLLDAFWKRAASK